MVASSQCGNSEGLTYQWFYNATNAIDGATNSALVLTNVQPSAAGAYSVRVRDPAGNRTDSEPALLTVLVKPIITVQPVSQTVAPGATITFSVQAEGTPPLHYQWRAGWVPGDIPGATNDTLVVSNAQSNVAGNYRVIVSNAAGSTASDMVVLSVVQPPSIIKAALNATNVSFAFISVTNLDYVVEYKDSLTDPAWLTLRTLNGDGGTLNISDSMTNLPSRFYRLRVQ